MFCGACGALLNRPLPSRGGSDGAGAPRWWRRPFVAGVLAVIAIVGIVAAVPTLSIQRTDPIENTVIDMPDADDLQGAPAGTRPRRSVDPPEVSCTVEDVEVDCVMWSRGLVDPLDNGRSGRQAWPMVFGDHVLIVGDGEVEAADAATGARLWRRDLSLDVHPGGAIDDLLLLVGGSTTAVDVATGEPRWSVQTSLPHVYGDLAHANVVYSGTDADASTRGLAARDPDDGEPRWTWETDWIDLHLRRLDDERVMVTAEDRHVAILDAMTGEERSRVEDLPQGWIAHLVGDVVVTVQDPDIDPSEPNRAGDPGAVVTGTDVNDGTVRWQRDVRSSGGWFGNVGSILVAPSSRHLTALDAATGETAWEVETTSGEHVAQYRFFGPWGMWDADAPDPDIVVTTGQNTRTLRGRDSATGELVWERDLQATPWHAVVEGDEIIVQTNRGIDIVATATGQQRLHIDSPDLQTVGTDPFVVFHPVSGYVSRLDVPTEVDR